MAIPRKYWILSAGAVFLVAAYAIAGFYVVPEVIRSQLTDFVQQKYARAVSLGDIHFNPFTLSLETTDLSFPDAAGQPMLGFHRLLVNLDVSSVWRRGASFAAIEIDQPFTHASIGADGALNLADLAKPFAAPADAPPQPESSPARVFIDRMRVTGSQLTFEDHSHATPFRAQLSPVSFELLDFSTVAGSGNEYTLQGQSSAGETFSWSGSFELAPLSSRGHFELNHLQARTLWTYLRDSLAFEVGSGIVELAGDYRFAAATEGTTLEVTVANVGVTDLGIHPPGQTTDYIHLASLGIADTKLDLAKRTVTVGKIRLVGGEVNAWREPDGRINLLELVKAPGANGPPAAAAPPAATPEKSASAWVVNVPDIGISALKLALEDRFVKPDATFVVDPLNLELKGFSTAPATAVNFTADLALDKSARFAASGELTPDTGKLHAKVDLSALDLTAFQPYLSTYTRMTLLSGALGSRLAIDRGADGALALTGEAEVAKLRTVDNALRQDFIKCDRLSVGGIVYTSKPARLKIATVNARAPYMRVIIAPDQTTNIGEALSAPAATPGPVQTVRGAAREPDPVGNPNPLAMSIGAVRISDASANFADFWIQPNYAVSIQSLNGSIKGLSSAPDSRAKLELEGKVDRYAPAVIKGDINLLSASLFTDIAMIFKGVDMTSVTPYSGRFAGYRIEKGKLSVDLKYHVENRKLAAEQHFVIDQLQLGERVESPEAVHLPLKIAVALLKDRNGVIDIGLPLTGSLDDPKFRVGPLIWKAFVGLLAKIATSPFALLGRLGGGGEDINLVDFAPGSAVLDADGQKKMATLVKAMNERPALALDVPASYSPEADGAALAAQALSEKLSQLPGNKPAAPDQPVDDVHRFDLLVAQHRIDFGAKTPLTPAAQALSQIKAKERDPAAYAGANRELEAALLARYAPPADVIEAMGTARARAIQEALIAVGQIDAARVFVIAPEAKPAADGKVRVELALK